MWNVLYYCCAECKYCVVRVVHVQSDHNFIWAFAVVHDRALRGLYAWNPWVTFFSKLMLRIWAPTWWVLWILSCRLFHRITVLSHEMTKFGFFLCNRFVFVLFTCHRCPPFLVRNSFTGGKLILIYEEYVDNRGGYASYNASERDSRRVHGFVRHIDQSKWNINIFGRHHFSHGVTNEISITTYSTLVYLYLRKLLCNSHKFKQTRNYLMKKIRVVNSYCYVSICFLVK